MKRIYSFLKQLYLRAEHLVLKTTFKSSKKELILFGSSNGNLFSDNSKYLFEWMLSNQPITRNSKLVWIIRNINVYKELQNQNYPVALMNSFSGRSLLHKAQLAVFTNSLYDIAENHQIVPKELKLLALRHGKSVKKVRYARKKHQMSEKEKKMRDKESQMIKYVISTSDFISDIQEECLLLGRHKHIVTGYPRNDAFFSSESEINHVRDKLLGNKSYKKTILYAPSWRHGREATRFFPFGDFEKEKLFHVLEKNNTLLLLRPHVNDLRKYNDLKTFLSNLAKSSEQIRFANHNLFPDVNSILPFVDVLISDYSALYHDFLLLDRPLMFIPYDYEDFEKQNGFLYDYFENLPGPAINTFKEFCDHTELLIKGEDPFAEKRRKLTDKIHTYKDAGSCERVAALIDKLLEG